MRPLQQCCQHRIDHRLPDGLVIKVGTKRGVIACRHLERDEPGATLKDVVEGPPIGERAVLPVALNRATDEPRANLLQLLPGKAELSPGNAGWDRD